MAKFLWVEEVGGGDVAINIDTITLVCSASSVESEREEWYKEGMEIDPNNTLVFFNVDGLYRVVVVDMVAADVISSVINADE